MKYNGLTIILGTTSIIFAYVPLYPKILTLFGALLGIIGIIMALRLSKMMKNSKKIYLNIAKGLCIFGLIASTLMFFYNNTSLGI